MDLWPNPLRNLFLIQCLDKLLLPNVERVIDLARHGVMFTWTVFSISFKSSGISAETIGSPFCCREF